MHLFSKPFHELTGKGIAPFRGIDKKKGITQGKAKQLNFIKGIFQRIALQDRQRIFFRFGIK